MANHRPAADVAVELLHDAPCGIAITDPDGDLTYVNATLARWTGRADLPAAGGTLPELLTTPGRIYYETHIAPMMRLQGHVREISCMLEVTDGSTLPVLLSG
ncbi:putative regulatory protein, partial [Oceanicola granulosus HTCC2516]